MSDMVLKRRKAFILLLKGILRHSFAKLHHHAFGFDFGVVVMRRQVRLLYKGTLRVLLVLLHDFPEFLCDHHFSFCDVIPPSCIQMRNLILSAFPRNMRLPDPFTPNLKVSSQHLRCRMLNQGCVVLRVLNFE